MGRHRLFSDEERAERIKISKKKWRDGNRQHIREYRAEYDKENRERTNRSLFEIIPTDAKSKVYVDYEEYVPRAGVTETENFKVSMHLVFPEMYTDNVQERRPLVNLMRSINNKLGLKCGCDVKVYGRNQQFKLVNQAKAKSTRVQIVMDDSDPMDHILTYFADTASDTMRKLQIATFEYVIPQSVIDEHASNPPSTVVDISGIEAWPLPVDIPESWSIKGSPPEETLSLIKHTLRGFKWYYDVPIDSHIDSLDELEITNKRKRDELEKTKFVYLACPMGSGKTQKMFERMTMLEEDEKSLFNVRLMDALKDTTVYDTIQLRLGYLRYLKRPVLAFYPYVAPHPDRKTIEEIARGAYASAKANTSDAFDLTYEKDCLVMQANMDDTERAKVMADVNTSWSSRGLVISNSTVTVGVSHTDRWFDRVVLCMNRAMNLRDVMQFTFRARNLQSNVIEVYDLGGHTSHRRATDLAHNSRLYKRDPVFKIGGFRRLRVQ
eukprot:jgi/Tetstr1/444983/TSEL_003376.t1